MEDKICAVQHCLVTTRATFTPAESEPIPLCDKHWGPVLQAWRQATDIATKRNAEFGRVDFYGLGWIIDQVHARIAALDLESQ